MGRGNFRASWRIPSLIGSRKSACDQRNEFGLTGNALGMINQFEGRVNLSIQPSYSTNPMKPLLFSAILFYAAVLAPIASAETVVVSNGPGNFRNSDQAAFFHDADGRYVWLDGATHFVVLYYT